MPSLSVKEQCVAALRTQVATITSGSTYSFTPAAVVRPNRDHSNYTPADKVIVVEQVDEPTELDRTEGNPPAIDEEQMVEIACFCVPAADTDATAIDTTVNERAADITTSLMHATAGGPGGFGGIALRTSMVVGLRPWRSDDGAWEGFTIKFALRYRYAENDPRVNGVS